MRLFRRASATPLWRDEFAISQADERYVNRRQFAKFLVLTSLGMFVGNVWIAIRSLFRRDPVFEPRVIGRVSDVAFDGVKLFNYPGEHDPCILVRTGADAFVAYSQKCTHLSCAVFYVPAAHRLECPCHEGYFAVEDGRVLQGPPPRPLPRVVLERRADDLVATGIEILPAEPAHAATGVCPRPRPGARA
jgi:nitrite reductase/ring-hydroxylating ferredoxin subunit